jgi:hypothetical protein
MDRIPDEDMIALVDASLDDGLSFADVVKEVRSAEGWIDVRTAVGNTLYYLDRSVHVQAAGMASRWRNRNKE